MYFRVAAGEYFFIFDGAALSRLKVKATNLMIQEVFRLTMQNIFFLCVSLVKLFDLLVRTCFIFK